MAITPTYSISDLVPAVGDSAVRFVLAIGTMGVLIIIFLLVGMLIHRRR